MILDKIIKRGELFLEYLEYSVSYDIQKTRMKTISIFKFGSPMIVGDFFSVNGYMYFASFPKEDFDTWLINMKQYDKVDYRRNI